MNRRELKCLLYRFEGQLISLPRIIIIACVGLEYTQSVIRSDKMKTVCVVLATNDW